MLNYHHAPAVGQFLMDLIYDAKAVFSSFDWGPAEGFPYLPRVQVGRIVLRPAQWRIQKEDVDVKSPENCRRDLNRWRDAWDVPQHVYLSFGDNRLVVDLEQDAQAAEIRAELQKLSDGGSIILQEVLPALEESWLPGPEGRYYGEFIASLVLRRNDDQKHERTPNQVEPDKKPAHTAIHQPVTEATPAIANSLSRRRPPGSEWLYVKLYAPSNPQDDVISDSMFTFAENAIAASLADSWFFIRYADPETHIRLRFHGSAQRLTAQLFPQVCDWAASLMSRDVCTRFAFDTYDQEIERFGGPSGLALSEGVFFADSRSVVELLRCLKNKMWPHDQALLLALSIDDLLGGLGLDEGERLSWYGKQTTTGGPDVGSEYRQRKVLLRSLIGQPTQFLAGQTDGAEIARILAKRREALTPLAQSLRHLAERRELGQSLDVLCRSFVHLHANRMSGGDSTSEQRILSLLLRTRDGLKKSPVAPAEP
jgi:thiopeptide-type bacteriocin biosynthesis protein